MVSSRMLRAVVALLAGQVAEVIASSLTVPPARYSVGSTPAFTGLSPYTAATIITLSPSSPLVTFDYGSETLGIPSLEITKFSGVVQIELKYTEEFDGLNNPNGDGPWTFDNGLSNTFRTETFAITQKGQLRSFFLQGGLRWQSIRLLTTGTVSFSTVGLHTQTAIVPSTQLPGAFNSSNDLYRRIWGLGGTAVQAACVDHRSLKSTWEITSDGALIRGQQTAQSAAGVSFSNYTMSFVTKIVRGGTGWRVAVPVRPYGFYFVVTSNYPQANTFVNTDRTLLPPNSLVVGYGWSILNQTSLTSGYVSNYPLPMTINENTWYTITTAITPQGYKISINGTPVATISYAEASEFFVFPFSQSPTLGTWGFGPFKDQVAYVKDVKVVDASGALVYQNPMTSDDVLYEYGVHTNERNLCLDGSKRDRLVWIGDFVHTARTLASSTYRLDYITGVMDLEYDWQQPNGMVPTQALMGASDANKDSYYPSLYSITDYQIYYLVTVGDYYQLTGDLSTSRKYWSQTKLLASYVLGLVDPYSGLIAANNFFFTGPSNGTAISSLAVIALQQLVPIALALKDTTAATTYQNAAAVLTFNINAKLWNPTLGVYSLSLTSPNDFDAAGIAFAIRSGVATPAQAASSISHLPALKYGVGYLRDTTAPGTSTTQLSPFILGFLLESLFIANTTLAVPTLSVAKDLLDNFWSQMVNQDKYFSGASWEYLFPDGSPGIGLFTSLSHPWGSAPTYVLPQYVLGVMPSLPGFSSWQFKPLVYGLGLNDVDGVVQTPQGAIVAGWKFVADVLTVDVTAPKGTSGVVYLPSVPKSCVVTGQGASWKAGSNQVMVSGGQAVHIVAVL